jgi:hypothetical protein
MHGVCMTLHADIDIYKEALVELTPTSRGTRTCLYDATYIHIDIYMYRVRLLVLTPTFRDSDMSV